MQFRPYGDTGRVLSCLGVEISGNIKNQYQYNSILKKAFERGINYIQFDYRVLRRFINFKEGLDQANGNFSFDIGIVVPSNIIKIKNILKVVTKSLGISSIDFLIIKGTLSDTFLITRVLNYLKKDNRVRHVIASVSDGQREIKRLENADGLDGIRFTGDAVLKALNRQYSYNNQKGISVANIFSGDKYKAHNSLIFIAKALSISDINIVTHKFINDREVDFVIDFIEKEEEFNDSLLSDEEILKHVNRVKYYDVLKGQKSLFKKIKSIFRKKKEILNV